MGVMHEVASVKGREVDVFEVGKQQLWDWCDWPIRGFNPDKGMDADVETLRKGYYVIVEGRATFGRMGKPWACYSCRSRKHALEVAGWYMASAESCASVSRYVHEYEVWHVVDDGELWQEWDALAGAYRIQELHAHVVEESDEGEHEDAAAAAWRSCIRWELERGCIEDCDHCGAFGLPHVECMKRCWWYIDSVNGPRFPMLWVEYPTDSVFAFDDVEGHIGGCKWFGPFDNSLCFDAFLEFCERDKGTVAALHLLNVDDVMKRQKGGRYDSWTRYVLPL